MNVGLHQGQGSTLSFYLFTLIMNKLAAYIQEER